MTYERDPAGPRPVLQHRRRPVAEFFGFVAAFAWLAMLGAGVVFCAGWLFGIGFSVATSGLEWPWQ